MDLALTDEQTLLRDAVGELLDRDGGWAELVEFGALEEGLGAVELALIAWSTGSRLADVPFVDAAALAYVVPGHGRAALCLGEPDEPTATLAEGRLSGENRAVTFAETADVLAVSVSGSALVLVRPDAEGVSFQPETTLDPSLAPALVRFDAAEIVELLDADVESAWSSVLYAAAALDEQEPDALRTASIAKAYAGRATLDVAHGALQVFGGIAFTAEHPAHRFLRRVVARREEFGTPRDHARRLGRALARGLEVVA